MLPSFHARRKQLQNDLAKIEAQILAIESKAETAALATPRVGRAKKGQTKQLIVNYLNSPEALSGANIGEVCRGSDTTYTSTYRVLHKMRKEGKAALNRGLWTLTS